MGEVRGFLKVDRQDFEKRPVKERLKDWNEFLLPMSEESLRSQGARCMDCGVPFCHWACPLGNIIPDWNDLVYNGRFQEALQRLQYTNNFPEITGRICPAPCEHSCVLAINLPAVTIRNIELSIIERAYKEKWIKPRPPMIRTGQKVAVVGSGPAGLACADQLNKQGHKVTVFEKNEYIGGLLTLGIPTFKLEKWVIERRVGLMEKEGVQFQIKTHVGKDISAKKLLKEFDAVVLCGGAETPRDLQVPGRELKGVYFAVDYLTQQTRVSLGQKIPENQRISAKDKNVIILGGGDTGSDCVGTANRQGAVSVKQFELLPCLPKERLSDNPWPQWAYIAKKTTSHEEGVEQDYCIMTKYLEGENGELTKLNGVRLEFGEKDPKTGRKPMKEIPGSEFSVNCDLLILAMGFLGPVKQGMIEELGLELDTRGNIKTGANYMSSKKGVFAAGDMRRGQSLVVWAIDEGRRAAASIHQWLMNK